MRILIVDDERSARQRVRRFLEEHDDVDIVGECGDGASAVEAIRALRPEVVVLDVQMPEMDGFAVLDALGDERPATIFATAYDQYAVRAFDVHAIDYVLKPVEPERLRDALDRARASVAGATSDARLRALLDEVLRERREAAVADGPTERLLVPVDGRLLPVQVADVDWIEAARNYVRLHIGKTVLMTRDSLTTLEARLDPRRFARIHRSAIVNLDRVRELQPWFSGDYVVLLTTGEKLRLSRSYRRAFESRFGHGVDVD